MADKKYVVRFGNAGPHEKGAIITKDQAGPDGSLFDGWLKMGAIAEASDEDVAAYEAAQGAQGGLNPRSEALATGDMETAATAEGKAANVESATKVQKSIDEQQEADAKALEAAGPSTSGTTSSAKASGGK